MNSGWLVSGLRRAATPRVRQMATNAQPLVAVAAMPERMTLIGVPMGRVRPSRPSK